MVDGAQASARLRDRPDGSTDLVVRFAAHGAPELVCRLAGEVDRTAVTSDGGRLAFPLRPAPDAALAGYGVLTLHVVVVPDPGSDPQSGAVTLTVDGPADYPLDRLVVPGEFRVQGATGDPWHVVVPLAEGHSLPATGGPPADLMGGLPRYVDLFGGWITLPLVALTRGFDAAGGSLLVTTPQGEDHSVGVLPDDGATGPGFELVQCAQLGRFGYRRVWRLRWVDRPGLVPLAAAIRDELRAAGLRLDPLPDKLRDRGMPPDLLRSVGGTHLWWQVDPLPAWLPGQLQADGLRSIALMGRADPRPEGGGVTTAARSAGFVTGSYFMSSDIYPPGAMDEREWRNLFPPAGFTDGWPERLARTRDGWLLPNWTHTPARQAEDLWADEPYLDASGQPAWREVALTDVEPTQGYLRCPRDHVAVTRTHALPWLDRDGYTGVLCDVTTANGFVECYAPPHPCNRSGDRESRLEQLRLLGAGGRLVASECGQWWALDVADAFEGMLKYNEAHLNNRVLGDYPFREQWWDTVFNLRLRIPLFGLVARQSVVRTMWWGHGHERHPETWDAKDALCAAWGANPIVVADPAHPLDPGTPRWKRFAQTVRLFDLLRERTLGQQIRSYQVTAPTVAVTEFEDGTTVRANVGRTPADGLPPGGIDVCG